MGQALGEFEQLVMLAVLRLAEGAYGVAIRRSIEERTGRSVSAGAIYTTLARLEDRGMVSSRVAETAPERSGQRRKYYRLEPRGAAAAHRAYTDVRRMAGGVLSELSELAARARPTRGRS